MREWRQHVGGPASPPYWVPEDEGETLYLSTALGVPLAYVYLRRGAAGRYRQGSPQGWYVVPFIPYLLAARGPFWTLEEAQAECLRNY